MNGIEKRPLMISRGWIQAAAIVLRFGLFIMHLLHLQRQAAHTGGLQGRKRINLVYNARTLWQAIRYFWATARWSTARYLVVVRI
jgi:negative regulator of replication initiation